MRQIHDFCHNTMFFGSPRVSTASRTSIHSGVFVQQNQVKLHGREADRHLRSQIAVVCISSICHGLNCITNARLQLLLLRITTLFDTQTSVTKP